MIVNNLSDLEDKKFLVIIIGSGPAGISAALRLEKEKIKTLLIEAGDKDFQSNSIDFLKVNSIGDHKGDLSRNRLRQFGGTSGLWGGNCNPMNHSNFIKWPIEKSDLDKYNNEAKDILNLREDFFQESLNKKLNIYNLSWSNVRFGADYLKHIQKSKFIHLSLNSTFLSFNSVSKNIVSINCRKNNKVYKLKSKFFILSCGGIENSRLLLWSRNKNKNLFSPKLPIGNYYMHHPYHFVGKGIINYKKLNSYYNKKNIKNYPIITCKNNIYIEANTNLLDQRKITNSGIYIDFENINQNNNLIKQLRCIAPKFIKKLYDNINTKDIYEIDMSTLQEQNPIKENCIKLSNVLDPYGIPLAKLFWKKFPSEIKSIRVIMEEIGSFFIEEDIGRLTLENHLYDGNIDYEAVSGNHQMGGTRIGTDQIDSVVDKNLKIHGINNLFVTGSSVFRTSGHCHPTFTIVQLSLRLADYIIECTNKNKI